MSILSEKFGFPKKDIYPIALDVTYEGYKKSINMNPITYTIENIRYKDEQFVRFCNELMEDGAPFICSPREAFPPGVKPMCRGEVSLYDEGVAYQNFTGNGVSFCVPVGQGSMHSNKGVNMFVDVYLSYTDNLAKFTNKYCSYLLEERNKLYSASSCLSR